MPAVPTGYTELDQALTGRRGKCRSTARRVSIQTQWIGGEGTNFAAAVADFAKATGIKVQIDSIGSSHETVLKTRIDGGKPPDLAMLAQPTPVLAYAAAGKVIDVATFMDAARSSSDEHPATIGLVTQGDKHLGHPVQGRREVDHLVPDQGLRGQGLQGPHDVGRADRPVRQDRRRRLQPVVRQRRRPGHRDRLAAHRLGRGSGPQDQGPRTTTTTGSATRSRSRTRASRTPSTSTSARSSSRRTTSSAATRRSSPPTRRRSMDPMFTDDLANPKCWMQKIPTWYGPDFFPDQRVSRTAVEVRPRD